ncbi:MAG: dephospho-CoA kinase [Pseudohongiellaceae bacterium]|nr:dephospho-CoA kinase [Pseudohongiellaceae bacterium]
MMASETQHKPPLVIGLTGGIGSGKSAATAIFETLGIEVVDADILSRVVVEPGTVAIRRIQEHFGGLVINDDGSLNRGELRKLVFSNAEEKRWLESLLHPLIRQETEKRLLQAKSPYVILSSPLLLETDQAKMVNRIVLIDAPEELQLTRTSARDGVDEQSVEAIMRSQFSREQRRKQADDIIVNDKDLRHLECSVKELHQKYIDLAEKRSHDEQE